MSLNRTIHLTREGQHLVDDTVEANEVYILGDGPWDRAFIAQNLETGEVGLIVTTAVSVSTDSRSPSG